jgi:hypothetical protein
VGIHPGGRRFRCGCEGAIVPDRVWASKEILSQYGNMSSATGLFILGEIDGQRRGLHRHRLRAWATLRSPSEFALPALVPRCHGGPTSCFERHLQF